MTCPRSLGWALSAAVAVFLSVAPAQAYYHYVHYAGRAGPFNPLYEKFDLNSNGPTMVPNKTVTFFVSAILDNLTTTIVMVSLTQKLLANRSDRLFFAEALPTPTFGTGGILWASLTLALLTIPVVIVATEEGLAAIPGGTREASLALGATKLETTLRVVLRHRFVTVVAMVPMIAIPSEPPS